MTTHGSSNYLVIIAYGIYWKVNEHLVLVVNLLDVWELRRWTLTTSTAEQSGQNISAAQKACGGVWVQGGGVIRTSSAAVEDTWWNVWAFHAASSQNVFDIQSFGLLLLQGWQNQCLQRKNFLFVHWHTLYFQYETTTTNQHASLPISTSCYTNNGSLVTKYINI